MGKYRKKSNNCLIILLSVDEKTSQPNKIARRKTNAPYKKYNKKKGHNLLRLEERAICSKNINLLFMACGLLKTEIKIFGLSFFLAY